MKLAQSLLLGSGVGGVGLGGVSKAYEVRERAVLQEYHVILQKLADRYFFSPVHWKKQIACQGAHIVSDLEMM